MEGFLFAAIATLGFAIQAILIKVCYRMGYEVIPLVFLRNTAFFTTALIVFCAKRMTLKRIKPKIILTAMGLGMLTFYLSVGCCMQALKYIEVALERFIFFSFPVVVLILTLCLSKRWPSKLQIGVLLLVQVGMYFLILADHSVKVNTRGVLWALGGMIPFAVYVLGNQKLLKSMNSTIFLLLGTFGACLSAFIHFCLIGTVTQLYKGTIPFLTVMGYGTLTYINMFLFSMGVHKIGAMRASLIACMGPFMTFLLGIIFLQERLSLIQIMGGVMIVSAVIILETHRFKIATAPSE
jgi:drug/metabolite transporter (DMT)-like permease